MPSRSHRFRNTARSIEGRLRWLFGWRGGAGTRAGRPTADAELAARGRGRSSSLNGFEAVSARISRSVWNTLLAIGFVSALVGVVWLLWSFSPVWKPAPTLDSEAPPRTELTFEQLQEHIDRPGDPSEKEDAVATSTSPSDTTGPARLHARFTKFRTEAGRDALFVYDGPYVKDEPDWTLHGAELPAPIESTHPTGALTFRFVSDQNLQRLGFRAQVSTFGDPRRTGTEPIAGTDKLLALLAEEDRGHILPELETRSWLVMKKDEARRVTSVEFYDPNGSQDYNPNNDVTMTLWPSSAIGPFFANGFERHEARTVKQQDSLIRSWISEIAPYDQPVRLPILALLANLDVDTYSPSNGTDPLVDELIQQGLHQPEPRRALMELAATLSQVEHGQQRENAQVIHALLTAEPSVSWSRALRHASADTPLLAKQRTTDAYVSFVGRLEIEDGDEALDEIVRADIVEETEREIENEAIAETNREKLAAHETEVTAAKLARTGSRATAGIVLVAGALLIAVTTLLVITLASHRCLDDIRRSIARMAPPAQETPRVTDTVGATNDEALDRVLERIES